MDPNADDLRGKSRFPLEQAFSERPPTRPTEPFQSQIGALVRRWEATGAEDVLVDLIGLGIGSTPAGDDVLVGILAGLRALAGRRRAQPQIDELNTLVHPKALYAKPPRPDRPDDSSRPIPDALCDPVALIGQAGEALPTIRRSIDSVAGMGATSGVFIVPGLALALRMILESAQQIPPAASASILAGGPTGEP